MLIKKFQTTKKPTKTNPQTEEFLFSNYYLYKVKKTPLITLAGSEGKIIVRQLLFQAYAEYCSHCKHILDSRDFDESLHRNFSI